jgi:hypothetical protein
MKFPKVKRCRANTLKGMIQILDKVLSEYVRRRDAGGSGYVSRRDAGGSGYVRCITCTTVKHWKEMDNGHFVSRNYLSTRFDPRNCNTQCPTCNRFKSGEQHLHGLAIDRKYGKGTAEQLQAISRVPSKVDHEWLKFHIELYRGKIKDLKESC